MTSVVVMGALLYQNYYNCRVGNCGIDDRGIDDRSIDDRDRDRGLTKSVLWANYCIFNSYKNHEIRADIYEIYK